jgi:hypothetical protein
VLFCNAGRNVTVTLSLTDSLYRRRALTGGPPQSMTKLGFRALVARLPGLTDAAGGALVDADYIFLKNLGFTDPKHPRFELKFEHFLDALHDVALARYPGLSAEDALRQLLADSVRPLCLELFGEAAVEGGGGSGAADDDARTVATAKSESPDGSVRSATGARLPALVSHSCRLPAPRASQRRPPNARAVSAASS